MRKDKVINWTRFAFVIVVGISAGCSSANNDQTDSENSNTENSITTDMLSTEKWVQHDLYNSLTLRLPPDWKPHETEVGIFVNECTDIFCSNLVSYTLEGMSSNNPDELYSSFVQSMQLRSSEFNMNNARRNDSTLYFEYNYIHVDFDGKLFGATKFYIKDDKTYVLQFSGLKSNEEYLREMINKSLNSVSFGR